MGGMREGELLGGRYRLGVRLGRGSMGQVFRAADERLGRDVAVKVVDLGGATDPGVAERFHRETIATARLNHPNIVTVFDADVEGRTAYLVMELLGGRTVADIVARHAPLAVRDAAGIGVPVARALAATHRIGVVHRDIKPANIMVDGPRVKLLDFGIALVSLDAAVNLTAPATTIGTAAYMSPEQAAGRTVTAASDIYALGGVLLAMLTGQPAYPGDQAMAVLHRHLSDPVPSVRERRLDVPAGLDALVTRMLAKDPAARPTAEQVVDELSAYTSEPHRGAPVMVPGAAPTGHAGGPGSSAVPPSGPAGSGAPTAYLPPAGGTATTPLPSAGTPTTAYPPAGAPSAAAGYPGASYPGRQPVSPGSAMRTPTASGATRPTTTLPPQGRSTAARIAGWLALVIVALLVIAVVWAFGSSFFGGLFGTPAQPTAGRSSAPAASPSPSATPSESPSSRPSLPPISIPPITIPSFPGSDWAADQIVFAAVETAIDSIDTSRSDAAAQAHDDLLDAWASTAESIGSGDPRDEALDAFAAKVEARRKSGDINLIEEQAIQFAVQLARAA